MSSCISRRVEASSMSLGRAAIALKITRSSARAIGAATGPYFADVQAASASCSNSVQPKETSSSTPVGSCCNRRTWLSSANASASRTRETIRTSARMRSRLPAVAVSPRTTASMSVVILRTPRAIAAIPPITIHGMRDLWSASVNAASASSILRSPDAGLLRTLLYPRPSASDLFDGGLGDRITWRRPPAHGGEGVQRRQ